MRPKYELQKIDVQFNRDISMPEQSVTRKEHQHAEDSITSISESVLLINCKNICSECLSNLSKDKLPINSLANGLWIGEISEALEDLS